MRKKLAPKGSGRTARDLHNLGSNFALEFASLEFVQSVHSTVLRSITQKVVCMQFEKLNRSSKRGISVELT